MNEEVELFPGDYAVSSNGDIISIKGKQQLILKSRTDRYGYKLVTLWLNGKPITRKVHRLVMLAFEPREDAAELTVNHKDGVKSNNQRSNLEWCSMAENHRHAFATGLHTVGENRNAGRAVKLTNEDVRDIKHLISEGLGNTEIAKVFGVTCGCIYSIRAGKSWTHIN